MESHLPFDPDVVEDIYMVDIRGSKYVARLIVVGDFKLILTVIALPYEELWF